MDKRYPLPTVAALITGPSGRILVVQTAKWSGQWGIPGGKIDWGETSEQALRREMREEVGLEIGQIRFAWYTDCVLDPLFFKPAHFTFANYFATSASEEVVPNQEIVDWAWLEPVEALSYPLNSYTRHLIQLYLEQL